VSGGPHLPALAGLLLSCAACAGAPPTEHPPTATRVPVYAPLPWNLVDLSWELDSVAAFESLAVDVTIENDVPELMNLYVAPIGHGRLGNTDFYGGVQTQMNGWTRKDRSPRAIGPGFIYSMWGERSLDAIRTPQEGFLESAGSERDFVSARRPFRWRKGAYTYLLTRLETEVIDGQAYTWVGASVREHERRFDVDVGALRFPGAGLVLDPHLEAFVEIYGPRRPGVVDVPWVTVRFGAPVVNGKLSPAAPASVHYPEDVPRLTKAIAGPHETVVTVGPAREP
jgi:hypothetical protein